MNQNPKQAVWKDWKVGFWVGFGLFGVFGFSLFGVGLFVGGYPSAPCFLFGLRCGFSFGWCVFLASNIKMKFGT